MKRKKFQDKNEKVLCGIIIGFAINIFSIGVFAQNTRNGGVIRLEATVIEGNIQKPNAFFVNTRSALVYDRMAIEESFLGEISKAVDEGSF